MRWLAILAVLAIVLMFFGGWLYFRDTGDTSEIILDKQEVKEDTEDAAEGTTEMMEKAANEMQEWGEQTEDPLSDEESHEEDKRLSEPRESAEGSGSAQ
ncbi:MAG: hypothetical protein ACQESR_10055 [Planctomycetota bacterium]